MFPVWLCERTSTFDLHIWDTNAFLHCRKSDYLIGLALHATSREHLTRCWQTITFCNLERAPLMLSKRREVRQDSSLWPGHYNPSGRNPRKGLKSEKNYGGVSRQCPIYQAKPTTHRNVPLSVKSWLRFKPRRYCHDRISTGCLHGWLRLYHFGDIVVILPNCTCQGGRRRDR